jgi:hypothetical protein
LLLDELGGVSTDFDTILEFKRSNMKVIDFETNTDSRIYLYKEDFEMFTPFPIYSIRNEKCHDKIKSSRRRITIYQYNII